MSDIRESSIQEIHTLSARVLALSGTLRQSTFEYEYAARKRRGLHGIDEISDLEIFEKAQCLETAAKGLRKAVAEYEAMMVPDAV
jgi:hypothetical protein